MSNKVKVAGIQLAGRMDVERNIRRAGEMIDLAVDNGAKLAVLPELWSCPWFLSQVDSAAAQMAETVDGPAITAMRAKAKEHGLYIVAPWFERDAESDACYNSAALIDDKGELAGVYRKVHVPQIPGWEERSFFTPSEQGFPVFDTPAGKLGIQLGWDLLFPEGLRALALAGATIVVAPMAVTAANNDLWQQAVLAGAFANGLWVCRVGRVGAENGVTFAGCSLCATPTGDLLDTPANDDESVSLWEIDLRAVPLVRRSWPFLRERRPEHYGSLTAVDAVDEQEETNGR